MHANTKRKAKIYELLLENVSQIQIAEILHIHPTTANGYVRRLLSEGMLVEDRLGVGLVCNSKTYKKGPNYKRMDDFIANGFKDIQPPDRGAGEPPTPGPAPMPPPQNQRPLETKTVMRVSNLQFGARVQAFPPEGFPKKVEWDKEWDSNGTHHKSCSLLVKDIGEAQVEEVRGKRKSSIIIRLPEIFMPAENVEYKHKYFYWCGQAVANLVSKLFGYRLGLLMPMSRTEFAFRDKMLDRYPVPAGEPIRDENGEWWWDTSPGKEKWEWETRSTELAEIRGNMPSEIHDLKHRVTTVENRMFSIDGKLDTLNEKMDSMIRWQEKAVDVQEKVVKTLERIVKVLGGDEQYQQQKDTTPPPDSMYG